MATKTINSRIQLKCDTDTNWTSKNPILKDGELGYNKTKKYVKIGDGSTAWNSLEEIHIDFSKVDNIKYATYNGQTYAEANPIVLKAYVDNAVKDLTGAMHFMGVVDKEDAPTIETGTTYTYDLLFNTLPEGRDKNPKDGDVILQGNREFIWKSTWKEFGKEGLYVLQSTFEAYQQTVATTYVQKNGTDRLMTANEGEKLSGIAAGAQVNTIETITLNSQSFDISNKEASLTIDVINCGNATISD